MVEDFRDILGNQIKPGDFVAVGTRSGNSGKISVAVVLGTDAGMVRVRGCWVNYYGGVLLNDRWGDTYADRVLVINKSVPSDVKALLKGAYKEYQKRER